VEDGVRLPDGVGTEGLAKLAVELVEVVSGEDVDGCFLHFHGDPLGHHLVGLNGGLAAPNPSAVLDIGGQYLAECPQPVLELDLI
jgi:hypothetical protein